MKKYFLLLAAVTIVFSSCKKNDVTKPDKDLELSGKELQGVQADNAFNFRLLKQLNNSATNRKNIMVSPLSISMALSMAANGAKGATLDSIRTTLALNGLNLDEINSYYHHLITDLPQLDANVTVDVANSIWSRNGFTLTDAFLKANSSFYNATAQSLDFSSPAALNTINNWVSDKTNGKIPAILDKINDDEKLFLVNAVYFKGNWMYKFDKSYTAKDKFKLSDSTSVAVDFMSSTVTFNHANGNETELFELPYGNGKYSMVIAMPQTNTSVKTVLNSLDTVKWNGWMRALNKTTTHLQMPKFKFSYNNDLKDALSGLGMGIAFRNGADFSGISTQGGLKIDEVKHKTFLAVDEDGTEAAAATGIGFGTTASLIQPKVDRPFIFAIREVKTGLIVFAGIVNNPTLTE